MRVHPELFVWSERDRQWLTLQRGGTHRTHKIHLPVVSEGAKGRLKGRACLTGLMSTLSRRWLMVPML